MEPKEEHWQKVYETKSPNQLSWTQSEPRTSLDLIHSLDFPKSARIIDVGGGDSRLVDFLLHAGYEQLTVLDISAQALERAKKRLGKKAEQVRWVVSDVLEFEPEETFDLWHDRAAFHFLTQPKEVALYSEKVQKSVSGHLILSTFSHLGPTKCSGLAVQKYSPEELCSVFDASFDPIRFTSEDHLTPFGGFQHFVYAHFARKG